MQLSNTTPPALLPSEGLNPAIDTNDQSVRLCTYEGNSQPPNTTPPALLPSEGLNPAIDLKE